MKQFFKMHGCLFIFIYFIFFYSTTTVLHCTTMQYLIRALPRHNVWRGHPRNARANHELKGCALLEGNEPKLMARRSFTADDCLQTLTSSFRMFSSRPRHIPSRTTKTSNPRIHMKLERMKASPNLLRRNKKPPHESAPSETATGPH